MREAGPFRAYRNSRLLRLGNQRAEIGADQEKVQTLFGIICLELKSRATFEGCLTIISIGLDRGKTVSKLLALEPLGLALSEKQIPHIVENVRSVEN